MRTPRFWTFTFQIESSGTVVNVEGGVSKTDASIDPSSNGDALVLGQAELDSLSDDPDELTAQLVALAGPGSGPTGGPQIYTDGFLGSVPPKSAIREIRINSNPFSSEYDAPGFARIEIFTKAGGDVLHGQFSSTYNDQSFNARSPLFVQNAPAPTVLPPYKNLLWVGSIGGPIKKDVASFTFDFNIRDITENAFIIATDLNSNFSPQSVNQAVLRPQKYSSFAPRLDLSINDKYMFIVRYQDTRNEQDKLGVGGFNLGQTAYNQKTTGRTLQITETTLLRPTLVNETRFQFLRSTSEFSASGSAPSISVQDSFTSGGAQVGNSSNITDRWEMTNLSTMNYKTQTIKWGVLLRRSFDDDTSLNNFNGVFTFFGSSGPVLDANNQPVAGTSMDLTGLQVYQRTLLLQQLGLSSTQVRTAGGGASLFSLDAGAPLTRVNQTEAGLFVNDDWKVRANVTLSYGLRYEAQTNIRDRKDWAPRLSVAWGVDAKGAKPAKTVLRAGVGVFYNRIADVTTLSAIRYNGVTQQSYLLQNPDFFPNIPSLGSLASGQQPQTIQLLSPILRAPEIYALNISLDRSLGKYLRLTGTYLNSWGLHMVRQRDVNAPLPGTGLFPYGDKTVRMMTESSARLRRQSFNVLATVAYKKVAFYAQPGIYFAKDDYEGLAENPYNLHAEWGPGFGDVRYQLSLGSRVPLPFKIIASTNIFFRSAPAYNITTGLPDPDGDGSAVQRPSLVNLPSPACTGGILEYIPQFGCFNLSPATGTATIPRNFARGTDNVDTQIRLSRTWGFVKKESAGAPGTVPQSGPAGVFGAGGPPGASIPKKYNLTFAVAAINPINHSNFASPDGNLSSIFFGKPLSVQSPFVPGNSTYNRKITAQLQLAF